MVATVLSLRWRILVHQYRRDWWRLLFVAAGAIWSLSVVPALVVGSAALSKTAFDVKQDALVALAALIGLAWVVVPLLATGVDDSLDPARFAPWGVDLKRLMPGLTVAAFATVPALFFVVVALVMAASWRGEDREVAVLVTASIGAVLAAMTWVFSARLATLWAVRLLATRWAKVATSALAAAVVAVLTAVVLSVRKEGLDGLLQNEVATALTQLGRTPLGSGFAAPGAIVRGSEWGAGWRLAMAAVWVVLLHRAWRNAVAHVMVHPTSRGGGARRKSDGILDSARRSGPVSRRLSPVTAAVLARTARSWRTDPRYIAQLVGALVFPLLMGGLAFIFASEAGVWMAALPIALGITIGWGRHNDLAYDSTAAWLDIVSGVRGVEVLRGRLVGVVLWAAPAVVAASAAVSGIAHRWDVLPAVAATALGSLGIALGVASLTSVAMPYRVPAPGESPFGADAGSIGASLAGQAVSSVATGVLAPLAVAPLACAFVWSGPWWAVSVVWAPLVGTAAALIGTALAGKWYDARSGRLIGAVR